MRKLASIQKIKDIQPIENADKLDVATILGWKVVVPKGQFQIDDYCVYFEVDSLLPDEPRYEFLKKTSWNNRYGKIRLKSIKLRGQISQGLVLPLKDFPEINFSILNEGDDLTDTLGIVKYEPIIPASLSGDVNKFTWPISKSDEERVESIPHILDVINKKPYYITCKLDGTSVSYILTKNDNDEVEFHACSKNYSIKRNEDNTIWQIAEKYDIEKKLEEYYISTGNMLAIQGELCGPGIQKNKLNLSEHTLFIFNIIDVESNSKIPFERMYHMFMDIPKVPLINEGPSFDFTSIEEIKEMSRGKYRDWISSATLEQDMEGIVIRSKDQTVSFKSINNDFLLKGGE